MTTDTGRAPSGQALVADEAPAGLHPSGFDPSRGLARQTLVNIGRDCVRYHDGAECNSEIVSMLREAAKRVTGGNCNFADDDLNILEHLARRAVKAGLTDGLHPDVARFAAIAMEARQGGNEVPSRSDDSAGPKDIAQSKAASHD